MRTLTSSQDAALAQKYVSHHTKVELKPSGGSWTDMTDYFGYNWIQEVKFGHAQDQYFLSATVVLWKFIGGLSLSPLVTTSVLHDGGVLTAVGTEVKIYKAVLGMDCKPISDDWALVFHGWVDRPSWPKGLVSLQCRDLGGRNIGNAFIKTETEYPKDPNSEAPVEDIMQEILDDHASGITLYSATGTSGDPFKSADSPNWIIKKYIQKKMSVQQALKVLADQIGYQIHYKWNDDSSDFELTLYDPGREARAVTTVTHSDVPDSGCTYTVNGVDAEEGVDWNRVVGDVYGSAQALATELSTIPNVLAQAVPAEHAIGTLTATGNPTGTGSDNFVVGSYTYTEGTDWSIGTTLLKSLESITNAINSRDYQGDVILGWIGPEETTVKVLRRTAGSAGNSVTFTASFASSKITADGSGTLGGSQLGKDPRTFITWEVLGSAGNSIPFVEDDTKATNDGAGYLGGTFSGSDATVARTFSSSQILDFSQLTLKGEDIRNSVKVIYGRDPDNRSSVTVIDSASITKYGENHCEIALASNEQQDSLFEGTRLAYSVLDALSEPGLPVSIVLPLFWPVEVGDYYTLTADGINYDTDQSASVLSYSHQLRVGELGTTEIVLEGKPKTGRKRWLRLEARGGVNEGNRDFVYPAPKDPIITPMVAGFEVEFESPYSQNPPMLDWIGTRLYYSTSSGFDLDSTTLKARFGKVTKFTVTVLEPGETYYVRLAFENNTGNVSRYSNELSVTTQKSAPYHSNQDTLNDRVNVNYEFGVNTKTDTMIDGWLIDSRNVQNSDGEFGTDVFWDATQIQTGGHSLQFKVLSGVTNNTKGLGVISELRPVAYGVPLLFNINWKWISGSFTDANVTNGSLVLQYEAFEDDKSTGAGTATLKTFTLGTGNYLENTWYNYSTIVTLADTDARFIRATMWFQFDDDSTKTDDYMNIFTDVLSITRIPPKCIAYPGSNTTMTTGSWTSISLDTETYDHGGILDTGNGDLRIVQGGSYLLSMHAVWSNLTAGDYTRLRFRKNPSGTPIDYDSSWQLTDKTAGAGNAVAQTYHSVVLDLVEGDIVAVYGWHDHGSNAQVDTNVQQTYFTAVRLEN